MKARFERDYKKIVIAAVMAVFLLLAAAGLGLHIRTVTVTGSRWYTDDEIVSMVMDGKWGTNTLYCYYRSRFADHKSIPFVEDYKIVFKSPFEVEIIVYEKSIVGYVTYMSSNMYFDKDGIIVESTGEKLPDIPLVTGLNFGQIVLHQPLPVAEPEIFEEILNLTQILSTYSIEVDEIHYNAEREAELAIKKLRVKLGSNDDMNGKIAELSDILRDYPDLDGTLYLDTYDESNGNPMYRFQKNTSKFS